MSYHSNSIVYYKKKQCVYVCVYLLVCMCRSSKISQKSSNKWPRNYSTYHILNKNEIIMSKWYVPYMAIVIMHLREGINLSI